MILIMIIKTDNNKKDKKSSKNCHNQKKYNSYRCDTVGF